MISLEEAARLCRTIGHMTSRSVPVSAAYAERVGRLLFCTGLVESAYTETRQTGYGLETYHGAWGYWQTELGALHDSILFLRRNPALRAEVNRLGKADVTVLNSMQLLRAVMERPALACAFARLHYLRVKAAVPDSVEEQAAYWKQHYNTIKGKGRVESFVQRWERSGKKVWLSSC